ncbi:hypothetical protein BB987_02115 [Photorhabdus temperata]|uniref:Lipoprotein n=1 Tax=Photorhabdus khanii NC19 TaxID=1004151 RepID=W3V3J7_9GAMM|nr:DUF1460 domain-containing protein [Photorhabdus khanii]ETS29690.1 Protein of unknown function (DUF1460) [Photorhabdus khanii NC19]OHV51963.1 hypothetical protein BB987_02115 [Photorhabdus temperata]
MQKILPLMLVVTLAGCVAHSKPVDIDSYTSKKINDIIENQIKPGNKDNPGEMIKNISYQFINTPYVANKLVGSPTEPEKLVIDFSGLDCFTFLDYVESLRKSNDQQDFIKNLIQTRYIDEKISFLQRKHFFTDWSTREKLNAKDVTNEISSSYIKITKSLNRKADGGEYIPGLGVISRDIQYIPGNKVNDSVIKHLKTGDYIGTYTHIAGLDVTHTGIFIMTDNGPMFRNASSLAANKKVVDSPFLDYVKNKPGIIVLRSL